MPGLKRSEELENQRTPCSRASASIARQSASEPASDADQPASPAERFPFNKSDLTYRRLRVDTREESNAVVVCIMDTSGSMDRLKKYLARSFFFLLYQFVCTKYQNTELVFIGHHTQAREVTEDEFFHKGESGGTLISSGYNKTLEIIQSRFHPAHWKPMGSHYYESSMLDRFKKLAADNFQSVLIERREDIWPAFKAFMSKDRVQDDG